MEYTEGYLAFLDILGFSNYVGRAENFDKTYGLFEFIKNIVTYLIHRLN